MTKCRCRNCDEYFDFTTAQQESGRWAAICPHCKHPNEIDIKDYLVPIGTQIQFTGGSFIKGDTGTISGYIHENAGVFENILYIIDRGPNRVLCHAHRSNFEILPTWKKLRRVGDCLQRVCHYPRNQAYSNVPCYNCIDRTKCNADIFEALATYEATDFRPEDLVALKAALAKRNLTIEELITDLTKNQKGNTHVDIRHD